MLGDSLKRRRGQPQGPDPDRPKPPWRDRLPQLGEGFSWSRWLVLAAIVLVVSFGVGYLLSTLVFFPRPETAGRGVPVPELYGETRADAETTIVDLGLVIGEVREMKSMDADSGRVLAQDPVPGQQLMPGAAVSLGVSVGPPELRVPPVVGLGQTAARDLLEAVGFDVAVQQTRSSAFAAGVVADAEPEPGTPQRLPTRVTIIVSTGPPTDSGPDSTSPGADPPGEPGAAPEGAR